MKGKSKMIIAYSILHYNAYEMTCECIEKLMSIMSNESHIIVVDNGSPNDSGESLLAKYSYYSNIHIILTRENLGFAKGNNVGFEYAKNQIGADIIVVMNNDVLIQQKDFECKLEKIASDRTDIAVVAPNIINRNGFNQNPFREKRLKSLYVCKSLILHELYYFSIKSGLFKNITLKYYHKNDATSRSREVPEKDVEGIIPHGSCIIYMQSYIACSREAFIPVTFFYCEEDILYDYLYVKGLKSLYTNSLEVTHMEKVSTNTIGESTSERELFQVKNKINSKRAHLRYRVSNGILFR